MNKSENYINFYTNCPVTIGYLRSIILDLQREDYWYIPNEIAILIETKKNYKLSQFKAMLRDSFSTEEIDNYIRLFLDLELAFLSEMDLTANFPPISQVYDPPYMLYTIHLELDQNPIIISNDFLTKTLCQNLIIEIFSLLDIEQYLFNYIGTPLRCIEIVSHFPVSLDYAKDLIETFPAITSITILNNVEKQFKYHQDVSIVYSTETKVNQDKNQFRISQELYFESKTHNPFYNKRLYITSNGTVKIHKHSDEFGNLKDDQILAILTTQTYLDLSASTKEFCEVCSDCEYRRICVDTRIPIKKEKQKWFFEKECDYNPYISLSKGDNNYKPLKEIGVVSNKKNFKIDTKKVNQVNTVIWN